MVVMVAKILIIIELHKYFDVFSVVCGDFIRLIVGHRDLNPGKDCPGFENVAKEYADLQPK